MILSGHRLSLSALVALPLLLLAGTAPAQDDRPGFIDNLFNRNRPATEQASPPPQIAQGGDSGELATRLDRIEGALRQLTGSMEELQHRNQQLEMRLQRMQDDTEYRFQQLGSRGGVPAGSPRAMPQQGPANVAPGGGPVAAPAVPPGRRSDVFNPAEYPNAPGAPRVLGNENVVAPSPQITANEPPIGSAGAPLDLSTLSNNPPPLPPANVAAPPMQASNAPMVPRQPPMQSQLPPPSRDAGAGPQLATLPPSATPQDEYDMAYGYVLHKDYALAEQALRDFLKKYPEDRLVSDAHYWLGESLFQRQRYRDAAESFLTVSTKFEKSGKAPNALLRLGQSLAALNQKEAACATLAEVERKYPRAAASVKRGVAQEQKRAHC